VIVWIWDADGPAGRSAAGVTDDEVAARRAAGAAITTTGAQTATVEWAVHLGGGDWMRSGYLRSGSGWTARCQEDGTIMWAQFVTPATSLTWTRPHSSPPGTGAARP
jgi:hypothetical protein